MTPKNDYPEVNVSGELQLLIKEVYEMKESIKQMERTLQALVEGPNYGVAAAERAADCAEIAAEKAVADAGCSLGER